MNGVVVYDSEFGNTEAVAHAIAEGIGGNVRLARVGDVGDLRNLDLLVCGSPTQGGRPTAAIKEFLNWMPDLAQTQVAAFDTRFAPKGHGPALRLLMRVIGYAAPRIERALVKRGGRLAAPAAGFIVEDKEGPLREGELRRAEAWGRLFVHNGVTAQR